jgi:site-specific recombinase XerD
MIECAAAGAGLEIKAHPHMLRHGCGSALANKDPDTRAIQGWLGHRSITSTAVYTALAPNRFKDFLAGVTGRPRHAVTPGRAQQRLAARSAACVSGRQLFAR